MLQFVPLVLNAIGLSQHFDLYVVAMNGFILGILFVNWKLDTGVLDARSGAINSGKKKW